MSRWLFKTEPTHYSFDDLVESKKAVWDGITNNLALKHLRGVRKGDEALVYHTGDEKQIVGVAIVTSNPYPDPKQKDPKLVVVDIKPGRRLNREVTLAEIKADKALKDFDLVRNSRLSVMPVSDAQWKRLLELAGGITYFSRSHIVSASPSLSEIHRASTKRASPSRLR
ncbi:MAG: EVE domain-containing protein [Acidobacteriia bacterium]|nr:EVE domain-containing protein [Terriglobia bacterium]